MILLCGYWQILRKIIFLLFLTCFVSAEITLDFLRQQPKSYARDFYILEYMKQNISQKNLKSAYSLIKRENSKLFKVYASKSNDKYIKMQAKCKKASANMLMYSSDSCIKKGLTYTKASKLSKTKLKKFAKKLENSDRLKSRVLYAMSRHNVFDYIVRSPELFFELFNGSYKAYKQKYLNHKILPKYLNKLSKYKKFNKSVELIVANDSYHHLHTSLLNTNSKYLNFRATFLLAINAIRLGYESKALLYLDKALPKAYYQMDKDNVYFWQYLITKNTKYLELLNSSWDINMYTIISHEITKKPLENIYKIKCKQSRYTKIDILDPFEWIRLWETKKNQDSDALYQEGLKLNSCQEMPHKAMFYTKSFKYKRHFYIQPYSEFLSGVDINRQALIYAIARQESRFVPASVSVSYALGMMQFMPFLAIATAKELGIKDFKLTDMFNPKTAYKFTNHHLNYLERNLHHPLYISYAYNGGIGFTKRMLKKSYFKKGDYEPYLSMELVPYKESRRYGKKVIANYVIYTKILGKQVSLVRLLHSLIKDKH